jgi:hypothetical protein
MQLPLIVRAIITGFGYKIGTELAKYVTDKVAARKNKKAKKAAEGEEAERASDEGLPEGLPTDPGNPGGVEAPARRAS